MVEVVGEVIAVDDDSCVERDDIPDEDTEDVEDNIVVDGEDWLVVEEDVVGAEVDEFDDVEFDGGIVVSVVAGVDVVEFDDGGFDGVVVTVVVAGEEVDWVVDERLDGDTAVAVVVPEYGVVFTVVGAVVTFIVVICPVAEVGVVIGVAVPWRVRIYSVILTRLCLDGFVGHGLWLHQSPAPGLV